VRLQVTDSSTAFDTGALRELKPFEPTDGAPTARTGGNGIDLALASRLAALLGGTIAEARAPDGGRAFIVSLDVSLSVTPPEPVPSRFEGKTARILVADDSPDLQQVLALHLRRADVEVVLADDGNEARELALAAEAAGHPFDVVLIDVDMPVMSGDVAVEHLRHAGYTLPIVALTAHALDHERVRCLAAGCDEFATKPIPREALLALVERYAGNGVARPRTFPNALPLVPLEADGELARLRESFRQGLPLRAAAIERSLAEGDMVQLKALAHKLKGTAGAYGESAVAAAAAALETQATTTTEPADVAAIVRDVTELCARAARAPTPA
jgi:CheY-like chemotaxis protein